MKIKLHTCVSSAVSYVGLNQYIDYWEKEGYIERIQIPMLRDGRFISWVGRVGGLCLEPSNVRAISTPYEYCMACQYRVDWYNDPKVLPWNFYVRDWASYSNVQKELPLEKTALSIFSGTIRGDKHTRNIWKDSTEIFSYRAARMYTRTNRLFPTMEDYYRGLAKTKYGLCLAGDCGGVCQRDIETMGLGCVPVYTPGVERKFYVPPQENVHFLFANNPEEMKENMSKLSDKDREDMAQNGIKYFDKYVSPKGLWNTVLETVEKYNIKVD